MITENFLNDRYKNLDHIIGDNSTYDAYTEKPEIIRFISSDRACELLNKHLNLKGNIIVHGDVDFDGIGSAYEIINFIKTLAPYANIKPCINKEKEHGIFERTVKYFNKFDKGLVIIVDSSSNNIDFIKNINHDVIVIDHHEVTIKDRNELVGKTVGGNYSIVTNMVSCDTFTEDNNFSAGLVVYEFLRYYQNKYKIDDVVESKKLYQWAVCTLFTDVINTDCIRNLYYINRTFSDEVLEVNMRTLVDILTYNKMITKSFIGFKLAPMFNRAIRAGYSGQALNIALNSPDKINELAVYKEYQDNVLKDVNTKAVEAVGFVSVNIGDLGIHTNYSGIAASKILEFYKKTAIAYTVKNGIAHGSFRGLVHDLNYRKMISDMGYFAEGHDSAFGIKIPLNQLHNVMTEITKAESSFDKREYLTGGRVNSQGKYHIDDMNSFKTKGYLWKIGIINSKISGGYGNLDIVFSLADVELVEELEKYFIYKCGGLQCKAFEKICSPEVILYIEYADTLSFYLRNKWS